MPEDYSIKLVLGEPYYSRFWAKVEKTNSCWLWHGPKTGNGYGEIEIGSRKKRVSLLVHILSYQMLIGKVPCGMEIDHLCRVRHCLNPCHLEPVTHKENCLRGLSPLAQHARQRDCIRGHSLEEGYTDSRGQRVCRLCRAINKARYWRESRAKRKQQLG